MYTGGQTDISISLGAASYSSGSGWGFLGGKGNSTLANIGYGFGALANISDVLIGFNSKNRGDIQLNTEKSDFIGYAKCFKL